MKESKSGAKDNPEDIYVVQTNLLRSVLILSFFATHSRSTISLVSGTCQSGDVHRDGRLARIREQDNARNINCIGG